MTLRQTAFLFDQLKLFICLTNSDARANKSKWRLNKSVNKGEGHHYYKRQMKSRVTNAVKESTPLAVGEDGIKEE